MCFRQKCGFLTFYIMCSTKNVKPNVSKPSCLNERTSKQFFTEIKRQKNHTIQLSRVNPDIPICSKAV